MAVILDRFGHEQVDAPSRACPGSRLRLLHGAFLSASGDDSATAEALVERASSTRLSAGAASPG